MSALIVALIGPVLVFASGAPVIWGLWRVLRPPRERPARMGPAPAGSAARTVAFVGASIMHGRVSAPLPERVQARLAARGVAVRCVNAGVNGDLAYNALMRAPAVNACAPDDVVILVGSNDVMGSLSERDARRYVYGKRLPQRPDRDFYRTSLASLVDAVRASGRARVVLCTLPPLGEDLASRENERVRSYNVVIGDVARARTLPVIDVYGALAALIERAPPPHRGDPMLGGRMLAPMVLRGTLGWSFERIGRRFGFAVLSDGVHLQEHAADRVAELIADALASAPARGATGSA
jgi:lysophospholipase L1-like esterase